MKGSSNQIEDAFYDETHPMVKSDKQKLKEKEGVLSVRIGLFVMLLGIVLFGVAGGWWWLISLPIGTVAVCTGVADQVEA